MHHLSAHSPISLLDIRMKQQNNRLSFAAFLLVVVVVVVVVLFAKLKKFFLAHIIRCR
jgi:hypothetical protein